MGVRAGPGPEMMSQSLDYNHISIEKEYRPTLASSLRLKTFDVKKKPGLVRSALLKFVPCSLCGLTPSTKGEKWLSGQMGNALISVLN